MNAMLVRVARWLVVPVAVALWELWTRAKDNSDFPPPSTILSTMHDLWFSGPASHLFLTEEATTNLIPSLGRLFAGWLLACLIGVIVGVAAGRSERLCEYIDPLVHFFRAIPPPLLVPVFIAVFSIGTKMQLGLMIFGIVWLVLLNSIEGARHVERMHIDAARVFKMSRFTRVVRIILPAAAPKIFAGVRLSLSAALILLVIAEYFGTDGIGNTLADARTLADMPTVWACIVLLGILGFLINAAYLVLERHLLAWHHGATQRN